MIELTRENYFDRENNLHYMSSSQFKAFQNCEAAALAELRGEYERKTTTSLLVGSYVDAHFEGTLDIFKAKNPAVFKKDGDLKADYKQAEYIINRIERDELFMKALDGDKQVVMTGEIEGVPVKIRIDSYRPHKTIVDLKIIRDFAPIYAYGRGKLPFYEYWGYDIQGAIYREVVRQNTGDVLPFVLAAATKESEPDIALISLDPAELDTALDIVRQNIGRYQRIKQGAEAPTRCGRCEYCKLTKKLTSVMTSEEFKHDYPD